MHIDSKCKFKESGALPKKVKKSSKSIKSTPPKKTEIVVGIYGGAFRGASANTERVTVSCFDWDDEEAMDSVKQNEMDSMQRTIEDMVRNKVPAKTIKPLRDVLQKMKDEFVPAEKRWEKLTEGLVEIV